ncbi:NAD(P)/FAD-dependent oxidoreductase [Kerstersia sp.]|uniref:NAD(P)/FAD-dependent oxidoreductase n=1 Tax=Kerstersia sp. TaxID=1930783 RepID=UPI003F8EBD5B
MNQDKTCIIIGAGMLGLCSALEFLKRGYQVTLVDQDEPGMGATFGNAGFITTESVDPLSTWGTLKRAPSLLAQRNGALAVPLANLGNSLPWMLRFAWAARPAQVAHARQSLAWINRQAVPAWQQLLADEQLSEHLVASHYLRVWEHASGQAAAAQEAEFYRRWGIEARLIDKEETASLEPALRETIHHAVVLPYTYRVQDPYWLAQALFAAFQQRGGTFIKHAAGRITADGGQVRVQAGQDIIARQALVCAGAYSADLLRQFGVRIPLMAERGYHLHLPQMQGLLHGPICSADRNVFISQLNSGLRIVGFSELGGTGLPPQPARFASMRHHLGSLLPQTQETLPAAEEWMGRRPTLPDSLPVIDTHPHHPNIGFAFGHQHMGITLAAISAQLISQKMSTGTTPKELSPYAVTRFKLAGSFS